MLFQAIVDDSRRTTDAGHRPITIAHLEHLALRLAKNNNNVMSVSFTNLVSIS